LTLTIVREPIKSTVSSASEGTYRPLRPAAVHELVLATRILVVEDERTPASFIEHGPADRNVCRHLCHDGERGEAGALTGDYALVLLDLRCRARPGSTFLERSARMPKPASDRADRPRSRRAERGPDRGAND
jgi:hypothetical protein